LQVHGTARVSIRVRGPRLNSCCRAPHSANQMRDRARSEPCFRAPHSANQMRDRARSEPCSRAPHSAQRTVAVQDQNRVSHQNRVSGPRIQLTKCVTVQDQNRVSGPRVQLNEPCFVAPHSAQRTVAVHDQEPVGLAFGVGGRRVWQHRKIETDRKRERGREREREAAPPLSR